MPTNRLLVATWSSSRTTGKARRPSTGRGPATTSTTRRLLPAAAVPLARRAGPGTLEDRLRPWKRAVDFQSKSRIALLSGACKPVERTDMYELLGSAAQRRTAGSALLLCVCRPRDHFVVPHSFLFCALVQEMRALTLLVRRRGALVSIAVLACCSLTPDLPQPSLLSSQSEQLLFQARSFSSRPVSLEQ